MMPYVTLAKLVLPVGTVVIREGAAKDWAAYWLGSDGNEQSGSLTKVTSWELREYGIMDMMKATFPNHWYRA